MQVLVILGVEQMKIEDYDFGMIEVPRPTVKPKEVIWKRCESLAEKYHLTPLEVLKRFVQVGMEIAEVEELGGEGFVKINGREIEIRVFDKKES